MQAASEAMSEDLPKLSPRKAGSVHLPALMAVYPIGDALIGMLSWTPETGSHWNMTIAERVQCGAMAALVDQAPPAVMYRAAFRGWRSVPAYRQSADAEGGGIAPTLRRWCSVREPRERVFHLMYEPPAQQSRAAVPRIFVRGGWGIGREVHIAALAHEREGDVE
jgi:hypothetical protein